MDKKRKITGVVGTSSTLPPNNAQKGKDNPAPSKTGPGTSENERLRLGYSRKNWKIIQRCHKAINERLLETMTNYFSASVKLGGELESLEQSDLLDKYTKYWKGFIKQYILNSYPGAGETKIRNRLLTMFQSRVLELRSKKSDKKVETE